MSNVGIIASIKRYANSNDQTLEASFGKRGWNRLPGTGTTLFPYKELTGRYRTGLDPEASYIKRISDPTEKEIEIKRVTDLKKELEEILKIDLGPTAEFWDFSRSQGDSDGKHVQPVKLVDGENIFNFSNIRKKLEFAWLRVYPTIASSYNAWERGDFPDATFYVVDSDIENTVLNKKKTLVNKAIVSLEKMSIERRKKVARCMGLPVTDNTNEETVYNLIDSAIKDTEIKSGSMKGFNSLDVFTSFVTMSDKILDIKDLVSQAISHNIYRKRKDLIYEGENLVAKNQEELVKLLADDENQIDLISLGEKLKSKKLAK